MRKPAFVYVKTKALIIFFVLAILCGCTVRFVSDLVKNPEDRFSLDAAHFSFHYTEYQRKIKMTKQKRKQGPRKGKMVKRWMYQRRMGVTKTQRSVLLVLC